MSKLASLKKKAQREGWHRWIRTPADEAALLDGCYVDEGAGRHVCEFLSQFLRHTKGSFAGEPFEPLDWQRDDLLIPVFGWKRPNGYRRFRQVYLEVPKKNGKSTLAAGIALYLLLADGEPGAEVYSCANDKNQAMIVFREAMNMAKKSPLIAKRLEFIQSKARMIHHATDSFYAALSADVPTKEGINAHAIIFDELHAQQTRDLWDTLRYAGAARKQPLLVSITTAGVDRHSICYDRHEYARKVIDGAVLDTTFFGQVYSADRKDDWTRRQTWFKANPSLGLTIDVDAFAAECQEAQDSPTQENAFRRYRLNQWVEQVTRFLQMIKWDACGDSVERRFLRGERCHGGLDLASTIDVAAFVLVFGDMEHGYDILPHFWIPAENMRERVRRDKVPYDVWARQGLLTLTEGESIDYRALRRDINALADEFVIEKIAYDRHNATHLATQLVEEDGLELKEFRQGTISFNEPTKLLDTLVRRQKLRHGNNAILRWMASNVAVKTDPAGNLMPDKAKSTEKIDGIVALIMALAMAMLDVDKKSIYDKRGPLVL
ncbi:Phage Terminase [Planctomycetes bacterium Pan216]|uniref:Phage Terminase n=1 Tax=Kolteria novifilia TaxID=2527975 RepID=A0A518B5A5_9BACT|nr:Phage Terminase [Planctomycetes bacterium Pan216]